MSSNYKAGLVPEPPQDEQQFMRWFMREYIQFHRMELNRLENALNREQPSLEYAILHAEPRKVRAGMTAYADGNDWNPGYGEGLYRRNSTNTEWLPFADVGGDSNFGAVKLLLHCNGANGSTVFTDSSSNAYTVTASGNAQISTTASKFGGASASFDGTGDYLSVGAAADWTWMHVTDAKWTVEAWIRFNTFAPAEQMIFSSAGTGASATCNGVQIYVTSARQIILLILRSVAGTAVIGATFATALPNDTDFHHIAVTWDHSLAADNAQLWVDGVSYGTGTKTANAPNAGAASGALRIGAVEPAVSPLNAYIDEVRITRDVIRYSAAFTPPGNEFQNTDTRDVAGPLSATANAVALFNGITGKVIKDSATTIDTDGTLAANSDTRLASQKATKTYADRPLYARRFLLMGA